MGSRPTVLFDTEIDKLTNSIQNALTGEVFDTEIFRLTAQNGNQIHKKELKGTRKELSELTTVATLFRGQRMFLDTKAASDLVSRDFND